MLQKTKDIYGSKLVASDGDIGHVKDFYFDDKTWVIRYLVADTGSWLTGRQVLLSPHALGKLDLYEKTLHVKLRRKQIEDSPSIEEHKPVSRRHEIEYYQYYGWPAYWSGDAMWGLGGYPVVLPPLPEEVKSLPRHQHRDDRHLQSSKSVDGYKIHAADGEIGHVNGFMIDKKSWAIREVVVETGHWYSGKEILISTNKVERISYDQSQVYVRVTKADIQGTPDRELVKTGAEI